MLGLVIFEVESKNVNSLSRLIPVKLIYKVMESHQASKLDVSGTAKAVISCFQKLGVSFEIDQVRLGCSFIVDTLLKYLFFPTPFKDENIVILEIIAQLGINQL